MVTYNGETFTAHETLTSVVDIEDVYQTMDKGLNDVLEFNVDYFDSANEENFYFFKIKEQADLFPTFFYIKDELVDGNLINIFYERDEDEDINQLEYKPGDAVDIEFYGISEQYHDYIGLLIEQYGSAGDLFSSTPVQLKGNSVSIINPGNYAFGYFRATEVIKTTYTFQ